jgi:hypothetical protein
MDTTVIPSQDVFAPTREDWVSPEETVRSQICGLLTNFRPRPAQSERRSDQRYPFPYLIHLTPVGVEGAMVESETIVVVGKHLSERGLGFYHTKPLTYRRMIVSFEARNGAWLGFLIDLTWCRFTKQGWYESGGRFLQVVPSPLSSR